MAGAFGIIGSPPDSVAGARTRLERLLLRGDPQCCECWEGTDRLIGVVRHGDRLGPSLLACDSETGARIALDGEIYDRAGAESQLRTLGAPRSEDLTDAEIVLSLYLQGGADAFRHLNGSWAAAIIFEDRKEAVLLTDRFGSRQLIYTATPWGLAFFPELKGVLAFDDIPRHLDHAGIAQRFILDQLVGERTLLEGVSLVPPGGIVRFTQKGIEIRRYWQIEWPEIYGLGKPDEWCDHYMEILKRAVAKRIQKPPVTGITLSSGNDTRLIMAALPRDGPPVHTFTFGHPASRDRRFARRVAKAAGAVHHETTVRAPDYLGNIDYYNWFCDGMVPPQHCQIAVLDPLLRAHVGAVLEGVPTASQSFYRYLGIAGFDFLEPVDEKAYLKAHLAARTEFPPEEFRRLMRSPYSEAAGTPAETHRALLGKGFPAFPMNRSLEWAITQRLRRFSNVGAAFLREFFEVRQPFNDYELFDHARTMPGRIFVDRRFLHQMIARAAPHLSGIPLHKTGLPADPSMIQQFIVWRLNWARKWIGNVSGGRISIHPPLLGYNWEPWLAGLFRSRVESVLLDDRVGDRGIFQPDVVASVLDDHFSGRKKQGLLVWSLYGFELWCRQFFDGEWVEIAGGAGERVSGLQE